MRYNNRVENKRLYASGFSAIGVTAALSVFVLVSAATWEIIQMVQEKNAATSYVAAKSTERSALSDNGGLDTLTIRNGNTDTASSNEKESTLGVAILDGIVSKYVALQDQGLYTQEVGESVAKKMAETLKPRVEYHTYTPSDVTTDSDTSYDRMLQYRDDLRVSLAPLLKNTRPEFEIFAYYIDTKDEMYLTRLKEAAKYYRDAAGATARVVTPTDAVNQHVAILNAMEQFAATLDALVAHAADPFASVALLRTYNQAEADVLLSFKALTVYYKQKNT